MWFGDLVTMRWWNDVWLSESFAEYMGFQVLAEATAFTGAWTDFALDRKTRGYDADQRASTHPVAPEPRGGARHRRRPGQLRRHLLRQGRLRAAPAGRLAGLARLPDRDQRLLRAVPVRQRDPGGPARLPEPRGRRADVGEWAASWLRSAGVDTLSVSRPEPPGRVGCVSHAGGRPHRVLDRGVRRGRRTGSRCAAGSRCRCRPTRRAVVLPAAAVRPEPALLLPNDGDLSYCKVRLDPASRDALAAWLGRLPDPLSRAVAWNSVRDLVRDGELAPREYLGPGGQAPARRDRELHRRARDRLRPLDGRRPLPPGRAARRRAGGPHVPVPGPAQPASRPATAARCGWSPCAG